jgi:hypothetical protein
MSFDQTYFQIGNLAKEVIGITHQLKARMCFEESTVMPKYDIMKIFYQRVKKHVKIINSFVFARTLMVVAHSNILSIFHVVEQKWIQHIVLEDQVKEIFRMKNARELFELSVLLKNGTLKFLKSSGEGGDHMDIDPSIEYNIPG